MALPLDFHSPNGTSIVHGTGSMIKQAFPTETKLPGTLKIMSYRRLS